MSAIGTRAVRVFSAGLVLALSIVSAPEACAQTVLELPAAGTVDTVKTWSTVRPDPERRLDPARLLDEDDGFAPYDPALEEDSGPVWIKLKMTAAEAGSERYVLRVARRFFKQFDYYLEDPDGRIQTGTATFTRATNGEFLGRQLVFDLDIEAGRTTTLLLYVDTVQNSLQPLELWIEDRDSFNDRRANIQLVLGLTFGMMLALIFHNFVLYLNLGQRGHLQYVWAMLSLLLLMGADSGLLQNYLLPAALQPHAIRLNTVVAVLVLVTIAMFFRTFLFSRRTLPRLDRIVRVLIAVLALGALAVAFVPAGGFLVLASVLQLVLVFTLTVLLIGAFIAGRNGSTEGYIFLAAWSVFVVSGVSRSLMTFDVMQRVTSLEYLLYFGAVAEASILALGLSFRVRQLYARHATALEEQHRAARLANLDPLTDAYNRRFLKTYLESVLPGEKSNSFGRAALILDLDNFKEANDRHGHAAGDAILRELVARCGRVIRERDVLCRLGGDEFVIVMADQGDRTAMDVAERLIEAIGHRPFLFEGEPITVTASVGVVSSIAANSTVSDILRMADQALYQAKRRGRNCAAPFDPNQASPFRHGTSTPTEPRVQQ